MTLRSPHPRARAGGLVLLVLVGLLLLSPIARADDRSEASDATAGTDGPVLSEREALWSEATPEERAALRAAARERWAEATPRERRAFLRAMRGLARALPEWSVIEHRVLLRRMRFMPPDERDALRTRLRRIDALEPDERARFVGELRELIEMSPDEARRIERNLERWREMPETERERYREQLRRFRALPVDERRRLLDEWDPPGERPVRTDDDEARCGARP